MKNSEDSEKKSTDVYSVEPLDQQQLAIFVRDSPAALAMLNNNMRYIASSNKWLNIYNLQGQNIIGQSHYDVFPEIGEEWKSIHKHCLLGFSDKREQDKFVREDGSVHWMRWEINPWYEKSGAVGGIVMFTEIITDRINLQKELERSETTFKAITEQATEGITLADLNGKFVFVNQRFCELTKYSSSELLQMNIAAVEIIPEGESVHFEKLLREKYSLPSRRKLKCKDNSEIQCEIKCKIIQINGEEFALGIVADISNQIEIEKELVAAKEIAQANENRLKVAVESAKLGIWDWDITSGMLHWDRQMFEIYGLPYKPNESNYHNWENSLHPEDKVKSVQEVQNAINGSKAFDTVFRILKKNGEVAHIKAYANVMRDKQGNPFRMIGVNQDITNQVLSENRLQLFKHFFENSNDLSNIANLDGYYEIVNRQMLQKFGYTEEELLKISYLDTIHPDDLPATYAEMARLKDGENTKNLQIRHQTKQGDFIWIEWNVFPNETSGKIYSIGRDITERKLAEEELKTAKKKVEESEARLIEAQLASKIGSWETDLTNFSVIWSPETYRIFDLNAHSFEASHESFLSFVHPDDKALVDDAFLKSFSSGEYNSIEHKIITAKGRLKHVEERWKIIFSADDTPIKAVGTCQDVTERILAQEQLALSSLIVNSSEDAIISKSLNGVITSWNPGAEKILGYSKSEAVGQSIFMLIDPSLYEEEIRISAEVGAGKSINQYETERIRKDGKVIHVSLSISPIFDKSGKVIGASKIMRDVSYKKNLEAEKLKVVSDLIQRNRELEQFSYIVSHNLRSPVTNIMSISEYFLNNDLSTPEATQMMKGLDKSVNALDSVIRDLNYILQKKLEVSEPSVPVNLNQLVHDIKASLANLITAEKVSFQLDFSELESLKTIKTYIYSIFYNLISNSIKYRRIDVDPIISIKSKITASGIEITFKDNGLGIDLNKKGDQLFMLYKRFHFHTEGKGMGLFMVKSQVETLGGKISVSSEVNHGTEFKITFPF